VQIYVDKPDAESLKGTQLQGALNSLCRAIENLCLFEGFSYREVRASGKYCPICGKRPVKMIKANGKRIYACRNRHHWDRDFAASWNAIIKHLSPEESKKLRKLLAD